METIKIFIGTSANGEDSKAEVALEWGLRNNSSQPVEITWMRQSRDPGNPFYGWETSQWSTPFTSFRWAIPELCNFKGRAIYLDVDVLNFQDIAELWNTDMGDHAVLARYIKDFKRHETSVMLFDCAKMKHHVTRIEFMKVLKTSHHIYTKKLAESNIAGSLDPRWNALDNENWSLDEVWNLHYTMMHTQPWKPSWYKGATEPHPKPEYDKLWHKCYEHAKNYIKPQEYEHFGQYKIIGR